MDASSPLLLCSPYKTRKAILGGNGNCKKKSHSEPLRALTLPPASCEDPPDIPASPFFLPDSFPSFLLKLKKKKKAAERGRDGPSRALRCRGGGGLRSVQPPRTADRQTERPTARPPRCGLAPLTGSPQPLPSSFKSNRFPYIGKHKLHSW